jgi:predicted alpha/beta superfamily hydrolase
VLGIQGDVDGNNNGPSSVKATGCRGLSQKGRARVKLFFLAMWASLIAASAFAQNTPGPLVVGERRSIRSVTLNEERPYWVYLPASYNNTKYAPERYPVLYLLDGETYFYPAAGVVQFLSSGLSGTIQIPELIIVAIPNTNRTRDLTPTHTLQRPEGDDPTLQDSGGGDAFLTFLRDELVPEIERTFRTKPYRIIVGHSFGGLFSLHALLSAPSLFQGYVAIDPSVFWDDDVLVRRITERSAKDGDVRRAVYLALSGSYMRGYLKDSATQFAKRLKAQPGLRSTLQYFPDEGHQSVALLALYHGLVYLFDGFKVTPGDMFDAPSGLGARFQTLSARVGVELLPPEEFVDHVAHAFRNAKQVDKAIELFTFNVLKHATSFNAYQSLAQAYAQKGETQLAIENYEQSLRLNAANDDVRNALAALRTQK